ncbi:hypothetical protein DOTSEDRAFT_69611 [Dothistroma septosporum NZE10]|uniref:Uncharacterized protein n=1 Tax=Dothistroma septosporum (strain NZE10 / CBS 128990) TaxID=675120 RepID=N1PWE9_DOTSN|nr:hypothetical protein DOTSEDRAFT_69611 [Dothistroma septosporum NZE10]
MASLSPQIDPFTMAFYATASIAGCTRMASAAITTCLATTALTTQSIFGLAVIASAIEIFAIFTLLASACVFLGRVSRGLLLAAWIPAACSCVVATVLSLITLATTIHLSHRDRLAGNEHTSARELAEGGLAVGVVALIPQTVYLVLIWPRAKQRTRVRTEHSEQYQPPVRTVSRRSLSVHLASLPPASPKFFRSIAEPTSPSYSASSLTPRSSFRDSAQRALKPMTSRTRLILHPSLASRDSRDSGSVVQPAGIPNASRGNDEFGSWDTSAVDDSCDSPFASQSKLTRLETIPGSRPVSPAYPLDGPFAGNADSEETALPESLPQSPVLGSETASLRTFSRNTMRRPSNNDQSHIHPLFRTESPVPPPVASPGTVITASVYAGQVVSSEVAPRLLYSSHGSRPASPIPSLLSRARSRTGSIKSFRAGPTSPIEPPERSFSQLADAWPPIPTTPSRPGSIKSFQTGPTSPMPLRIEPTERSLSQLARSHTPQLDD